MAVSNQRSLVQMESMKASNDHVGDHERRLEAEIKQLCIDIRRIGPTFPEPEPHVLFGELFDDEQVEQYYEALVGTLKSAKKRGLINFKGQMLLKGAHDRVIISLAGAEPIKPVGPNALKPHSMNKPYKSLHTKSRTAPQFSYMNKSPLVARKTFSSTSSYHHSVKRATSLQYQPNQSQSNKHSSTKTTPSSLPTTSNTSLNMQSSFPPSVIASSHKPHIIRSVTAPSCFARTELRDRIEEEIPQLLKDIRRIGTPGEPAVKFGDLFDDEEVEQFYEALVGTLKSAKKRGYISFKGQMLLKGMHDNVVISIQKEL